VIAVRPGTFVERCDDTHIKRRLRADMPMKARHEGSPWCGRSLVPTSGILGDEVFGGSTVRG